MAGPSQPTQLPNYLRIAQIPHAAGQQEQQVQQQDPDMGISEESIVGGAAEQQPAQIERQGTLANY